MDKKKQKFTDLLPTRMSLLHRASIEQQPEAWDELLKYYEPFVKKILLRSNISGTDLDDARQQVFMRLWKGLLNYKQLNNGSRFRNWLSTLIRRTAINWYNSQKHQRNEIEIDETMLDQLDSKDSEVDELIEKEWQQYIVNLALEQLKTVFTGNAFEVLAMSLEGHSGEEIAQSLNLRKESVYVLRSRVKGRLREEIKSLRYNLEGRMDA